MLEVELICFGNELLIGKTVNTNANWLGKRITSLGGHITRITTIEDNMDKMVAVINEAINRYPEIIITTGGLGTTFDDMALAALAKATNQELVLNKKALTFIKTRLEYLRKERDIELALDDRRKKMATLPEKGIPLKNRAGSAPGVLVKFQDILIFALPGVPPEMKAIFDNEVVKYFAEDKKENFLELSLVVFHVPESELAAAIGNIREQHKEIYFKTHPHSSKNKEGNIEVEIHLTAVGNDDKKKEIQTAKEELITLIKQLRGANGQEPKIIVGSEEK